MTAHDITDTPCHRACCWTPTRVCAQQYRCEHHTDDWGTAQAQLLAASFAAEVRDARTFRNGRTLSEPTRRAILAAQCGADGAREVARQHHVPVGAVRDIWKTAERGD